MSIFIPLALMMPSPSIADKFDLVCTGETKTIDLETLSSNSKPFATRLRIDLASKKFCADECGMTMDIFEVTPSAIIFEKGEMHPAPGQMKIINQVNRETGTYLRYSSDRGLSVNTKAACEVAEFTPLRIPKTKF